VIDVSAFTVLLVLVPSAVWVYRDASKRDWTSNKIANKPWQWAFAVFAVWIIAVPLYLLLRRRRPILGQ
jgi:hypothetical protein